MAVIASALNSLQLVVDEEVAALQLNQFPMLNRIQKKTISQKAIKWNVNVSGAAVTGEATTANVTTYSEDSVVSAQLAIGANRLRHSFQIQKEDIAEAKAAGKGALRDLFGYEIQSGIRVLMESLSGLLYTGAGAASDGGLIGLTTAVPTTAGAYAGIAASALWNPYVNHNATARALSLALLLDIEAGLATKGATFSAIYTTPAMVVKYKTLFNANTGITNILEAGKADLGYTGVSYAGRPIIQDPYCTPNAMYFLNESEVSLYTFAQNNTSGNQGMQFAIEQLPSSNPDAENYAILVKPQLQLKNRPKAAALLSNVGA
ncbi:MULTISPECIES: phage major capsid protein [unclassified Nostoc]|uniref:phage major capsid protein n=1 Tax=unclassified Nostoc TaxID=2593658 RepID=UPI002AD381DA|nr:phage major capsid protein [Nostoc sp. DedQUE03]MDZ7975522.1 phage major capsid protein [Nostoc sp. DedQUE03]MDZ8045575.1 phage major capsid protein [Nostoc sp. DedQUE02]